MSRHIILALIIVLLALAQPGPEPAAPAFNPDNLIRLHVVANSESPADQAVKIQVRDALLANIGPSLVAGNVGEARAAIATSLTAIESVSRATLASLGQAYPVRAELGRFDFPTRAYGGEILPAGSYEALKVTLGAGAGQNWWCVLFPPLCLVDVATARPEGEAAQPVMAVPRHSGPAQAEVRFKLLELWQAAQPGLAGFWKNR